MGTDMNFMGSLHHRYGVRMGLKLMGMGWGRENFVGMGWGWG